MKDTARLIITFDCKRNCPDCCNKTDPSVKTAEHIKDLSVLKNYPYICITGGEPMLDPKRTLSIIHKLRYSNPNVILYLYSAWYNKGFLLTMIDFVDGLYYTIHYPTKESDIDDFYELQGNLCCFNSKSHRLFIDNRVYYTVSVVPNQWARVEIKPWIKECSLPTNETLYILDG